MPSRYSRRSFKVIVLACCITASAMLLMSLPAPAQELASLDFTSSSPIYSYFEGMRARYPLWTPAATGDPLALWINSASLGTGKSKGISYIHTYTDSTFSGDDAFSLSFGGLAFGAEFFDLYDRVTTEQGTERRKFATRRYTLAFGRRLFRNFYFGTSYAWHTSRLSDIDKGSSWAIGALLRPHKTTSIGFAARDLNEPRYYGTRFKPIYETSLAVRPWNERFSLFLNWLARSEELKGDLAESQPTSFFTFGREYEMLRGMVLKLGGDEDNNFSAALAFLIGQGGLGTTYTSVKGEGDARNGGYGAIMATVSSHWRESVMMPQRNYLEINLSGHIAETRPPFSLFGGDGPRHTLGELLAKIDYAKETRDIQAIVLRCGGLSANFAILDELRQALIDFRKSGKAVVVYMETPGNGVYYLATAGDYIVLTPNGYIGLVGLRSEVPFLKGTLEKLGLKAYYARVGKYKSAVEPLTEDEYTEPGKEAVNALLDDVFNKLVGDIARGRGFGKTDVLEMIDRGPFIPSEALREGLVDTLAYWDEIPGIVKMLAPKASFRVSYGDFADRKPADLRWDEPPAIGIVYGVGGIVTGSSRRELFVDDIMGSETISKALRAMRNDRAVKAVVFRVDSPGGMMTASDMIRREIELTAKKKPVIISMGGVAASGGYHISCNGTDILADEATVTGSIGVLSLWLHTRGLYEKIGANKDIFMRGKRAGMFPTWRDVTEEDLETAQYYVDKFYGKFVADVAEGRGMGADDVHEVAQGRVWSGRRAQELGLVDRIGGLTDAISLARSRAGIPAEEKVRFKVLPRAPGFFETLGIWAAESIVGEVTIPEELEDLVGDAAYWSIYDEPILYLMPYQLELE